jgi:glycosyltransferase involved in cell wall biosynthesis
MRDDRPRRLLIASHGHPQITRGGAEISAFQLFRQFHDMPGWEAWFLGCQNNRLGERLGTAVTQPFSDREFVYSTGSFEWFKFANRDPNFPKAFCSLLAQLQPDIVHFHHFINFGVEAFYHVRQTLPNAKIILTLHEYLAMCHHYGQMITREHENLCYEAQLSRCNRCFPGSGPADFFLRKLYVQSFFAMVDQFVSPSKFLAERLVAWGIPEQRITVIENVIPAASDAGTIKYQNDTGPLRIGFFGQISRLKGINVLFDAASSLEAEGFRDVVFDIHGDYHGQPPEFQNEFLKRLDRAGCNVRFHGPYDPQHVDLLMRQTDVTIVPSIWWENSPVVIQEAFRNRRPVICSNIGGMAEKVRDGEDGWHFPVGSSTALVALLKRLCRDRDVVGQVSTTIQRPPDIRDIINAHVHVFDTHG